MIRGVTRGEKGSQFLDAKSLWRRRITVGAPKSSNNVTSTFFNRVHLLPKDIRFEHGSAKLASCLGRHLASLRTWVRWVLQQIISLL